MKTKESTNKPFDPNLVGRQQLLIKAKLKDNGLIAKQQLAVKAALAGRTAGSRNEK